MTWKVTREDIGNKPGTGEVQITVRDTDQTVIKTAVAKTSIEFSLGNPDTPAPEPVKNWIDRAEEVLVDVERAGSAAQDIADEVKRKLDAGEFTGATPQIKAEATTGEPGTQVSVTQSGTPENPVLSFVIPRGDKGEKGDKGEPGTDGSTGATGATPQIKAEATTGEPGTQVSVTQSGTPENPLLSFVIPRGDKGDKGDKGEPGTDGSTGATGATPQIKAEATTGEPGTQVSVTQSGTPENPLLSFVIPRGKDAPQEAVLFTEQTLTQSQQEQARANIDAADKARQNILSGSETGNPIAVDDAFAAPLCGLTVYGKSTQDGTPSPDNPVPIVSAGDGGSVGVRMTGKNLIQGINKILAPSEAIEGGVRIVNDTGGNSRLVFFNVDLKKGVTYTISFTEKVVQGDGIRVSVYLPDIEQYVATKFSPRHDTGKIGIYLNQAERGTIEITNIQLEIGTDSTPYSPYREQLLTLLTPNGLPGIPVTSGGNYTDSTGQQWVCDEVDLERGMRVRRIASFVISSENAPRIFITTPYTHVTVATTARIATPDETTASVRTIRNVFCEVLPWGYNVWASTVNIMGFVENNSVDFTIENSYLGLSESSSDDERKTALVKYFTDNPCRVVYIIATPIETPLTPAEIAAYKALTTYAPDTVVQVSDGAGVKLGYQRDVNLVVKNLEDAIASMTTA